MLRHAWANDRTEEFFFIQRLIHVDTTSWLCIGVNATSLKSQRCVPARNKDYKIDFALPGSKHCIQIIVLIDSVLVQVLTLKAPITTAADDIFFNFFYYFQRKQVLTFHVNLLLGRRFTWKTCLDISCESSAWQAIHMKCQDLFSLKN